MFLQTAYKAEHFQNRMKHEGDVVRARDHFFSSKSLNLRHLLSNRFEWMNEFITNGSRGLEVGCGAGISKEFIKANDFIISDLAEYPWLDACNIDALETGFPNGSFDFIVSSNMVHHVPFPIRFFEEMSRILKPGGLILIQEINASLSMRVLLRLMRHEGYSFDVDVFNPNIVCTDPDDLWSANCAIPNLLFDDPGKFQAHVPQFEIIRQSYSELFNFINSGGVIAKTFSIPLPKLALKLIDAIDNTLANAAPSLFALQRQIVLKKVG
jgi:SAM-dependent methyltransferase